MLFNRTRGRFDYYEETVIYEDTTTVDEYNTQEECVELYDGTAADYEEVIFEDITDYGTDSNAVGTADTSESVDEEQSGEEGSVVDLDSVIDDTESTDTDDESPEESVDDAGEQTEETVVTEVDATDFLGVRSFTAVSNDGTITATLITENTLYPSLYFGFYEDVEKAPVYTAVIQEDGSLLFEFTMFEDEQGVPIAVVPADAEGQWYGDMALYLVFPYVQEDESGEDTDETADGSDASSADNTEDSSDSDSDAGTDESGDTGDESGLDESLEEEDDNLSEEENTVDSGTDDSSDSSGDNSSTDSSSSSEGSSDSAGSHGSSGSGNGGSSSGSHSSHGSSSSHGTGSTSFDEDNDTDTTSDDTDSSSSSSGSSSGSSSSHGSSSSSGSSSGSSSSSSGSSSGRSSSSSSGSSSGSSSSRSSSGSSGSSSGSSSKTGSSSSDAESSGKSKSGESEEQEMIRVENAPELFGYSYEGTIKNEFAELFRVHCYSDEVYILEICVSENEDFSWDDFSGEEDDSESEDETSLYTREVLRYLILPKGMSVPEEIEEDMIPLTLPIQSIYASENSVRENLKAAGYSGNVITSTGENAETASSSGQERTFPENDSLDNEIRKKRKAETAEMDTASEEKAVTNSPSEAETDTELTESDILLRLINEDVDLSIR